MDLRKSIRTGLIASLSSLAAPFSVFGPIGAVGAELEVHGFAGNIVSLRQRSDSPVNPGNIMNVSELAIEPFLSLSARFGAFSGRVRASRESFRNPHAPADSELDIKELSYGDMLPLDLPGRFSVGKRILSWDPSYVLRPLGFFQDSAMLTDLLDREGRAEGLPLSQVTWFHDRGSATLVFSDDFENRADGYNEGLRQVAARYSTSFGRVSVAAVARKVIDGSLGFGGSSSFDLGETMVGHVSAFAEPGTRRRIHRAVHDRSFFFTATDPYGDFRRNEDRWYKRAVAGLTWTPAAWGGASILAELIHDQTGLSEKQWNHFRDLVAYHGRGMGGMLPARAVEGNLLHDGQTFDALTVRRNYAFLRTTIPVGKWEVTGSLFRGLADNSNRVDLAAYRAVWRDWSIEFSAFLVEASDGAEFSFLPLRKGASVRMRFLF